MLINCQIRARQKTLQLLPDSSNRWVKLGVDLLIMNVEGEARRRINRKALMELREVDKDCFKDVLAFCDAVFGVNIVIPSRQTSPMKSAFR